MATVWTVVVGMAHDGRAIAQETPMATVNGIVKRLVSNKGFGFVAARVKEKRSVMAA